VISICSSGEDFQQAIGAKKRTESRRSSRIQEGHGTRNSQVSDRRRAAVDIAGKRRSVAAMRCRRHSLRHANPPIRRHNAGPVFGSASGKDTRAIDCLSGKGSSGRSGTAADDRAIDALLSAVTAEAARRGRTAAQQSKEKFAAGAKPQALQAPAEDGAESLTTGKLNAVRAAFKAGVRPSAIARPGFHSPMSGRRSPPRAEPANPGADGAAALAACRSRTASRAPSPNHRQRSKNGPILAGAANSDHAARTRSVSTARLRLSQTKLSRNSNQIARGRIRQFESYIPRHAVGLTGPPKSPPVRSPPVTPRRRQVSTGSPRTSRRETGPPGTSSSKTPTTSLPVCQASVSRLVRPSIVIGPSLHG
jgi:hypothetical protein